MPEVPRRVMGSKIWRVAELEVRGEVEVEGEGRDFRVAWRVVVWSF